jgi:PmbA protein
VFQSLAADCAARLEGGSELWGQSELERALEWDGEVLKSSETSQDEGVMLRVEQDGVIGSAYGNNEGLTPQRLVEDAEDTTRFLSEDSNRQLSQSNEEDRSTNRWYDETIEEPVESRRKQIESVLREESSRDVVRTLQVSYSETRRTTSLFRGDQPLVKQHGTSSSFSVWAVCERDGEVETGFDVRSSWQFSDLDPQGVVDNAVRRGKRQLGAEPADRHRGRVLLTGHAASTLMRLCRQMLDGESIVKSRSAWSNDRLGETVAGENVTIIDDPSRPDGAGNREYDAEGYEMDAVTLVEDGNYRKFLTNQYVASRAGVENVCRASRSYQSRPGIGHTNLYIEPGDESFDSLEEALGEGPVVTGIQPGSGLDAVAGHLSVGAEGYFRESDGQKKPFSEGTLSGSLEAVLKNLLAIGDTFPQGRRLASPALLVEDMTLGGAS